ncbi:thioesterase family protein [Leifsonia sp. NPDC058248]|uniref:thioesterase family protein n=1 Tax=Leifsonia sp. NPDC058248 TaxID=3346402 RepID=UPI0036DE858A
MTPTSDAYFEQVGETLFRPTPHAGGAWSDAEIHFSPLGGLVVHAIERHIAEHHDDDLVLSRISFDILGFLAAEVCEVRVETIRPGRTIQLIEATVLIAGRTAVRARAWYLSTIDTRSVAGGADDRLASPEDLGSHPLTAVWPGGFVASLDVRPIAPAQPGRAAVWLTSDLALVAGEEASGLASWIALVDTANGIAVRQSPDRWMFPNVDLSIHLHRQPEGRWVGMDTTVTFGPTGQGVTSTVLHDLAGPVGYAQQSLTVRPLKPQPDPA